MASIDQLKQDLEIRANLLGKDLVFRSTWGLFSPREIDDGT